MAIVVVGARWGGSSNKKIVMTTTMVVVVVFMSWLPSSDQQYLSRTMTRSSSSNSHHKNKNNGNNVFIQRPFSSPPTIRAPPYYNSHKSCSVLNERENWEGNLCGDLNSGEIPQNPFGHTDFEGDSNYPFEAIKNKTLDFFRKALPVLKTYKSLPKVARYGHSDAHHLLNSRVRARRDTEKASVPTSLTSSSSLSSAFDVDVDSGAAEAAATTTTTTATTTMSEATEEEDEGRALRSSMNRFGSRVKRTHAPKLQQYHRNTNNLCENAIFCKLLNTMYDKLPQGFQRLVSQDTHKRLSHQLLHQLKSSVASVTSSSPPNHNNNGAMEQLLTAESGNPVVLDQEQQLQRLPPQTPCPSSAEYLTPVFARNHEGAWRYVVQIPREGYFTQTVEVTKCIQSNCMYMEGNCRTSPRWQSLLVAELYYPDAAFPLHTPLPLTTTKTSSEFNELKRQKRQSPSYRRRHYRQQISPVYSNMTTTTTSTTTTTTTTTTEAPTFGLRMKRRRRRNGNSGSSNHNNNYHTVVRNYDGRLNVDSTESIANKTSQSKQCDGYDEIGCYQFRLFYDWFLIPGECKCWRKSFANFFQK